jgi:hypothetical protein
MEVRVTYFKQRNLFVPILENLHLTSDSSTRCPQRLALVILLAYNSEGGGIDTPNHVVVIVPVQ